MSESIPNKPKYYLGLSYGYHDSAATLIRDQEIVCAFQEERFTRIKHDSSFPSNAITACLEESSLQISDIDYVVYYECASLKFKRVLYSSFRFLPKSLKMLVESLPRWLFQNLHWKRRIVGELKKRFSVDYPRDRIVNGLHHRSHASSSFYPSPFDSAAILVIDGVGEFDTASIWHGSGKKINCIERISYPHSLGLLYSAFTQYLGFKVNSGEYKMMGLAPYGNPIFYDKIKEKLLVDSSRKSFEINLKYFDYMYGYNMINSEFCNLFGQPKRKAESELKQFHMDIAASIQKVIEDEILKLAKLSKELTGESFLCLSGGVALNCVANGKIKKSGLFKDVWVQPASGDAGTSLGCALDFYFSSNKSSVRTADGVNDSMKGSLLGKKYSHEEIKSYLESSGILYSFYEKEDLLFEEITKHIVDKKVIGLFQGRMEFGPRALGGRSIIACPTDPEMQKKINLKIKFRESFRPFAPIVMEDFVSEYFDFEGKSPYMLMVSKVHQSKLLQISDKEMCLDGLKKLGVPRSVVPSITHVDNSARIQTVNSSSNPFFFKLLSSYHAKTGTPLLINTSFNVRGEPIVNTPEDAYKCFLNTNMDVLVLENFIVLK